MLVFLYKVMSLKITWSLHLKTSPGHGGDWRRAIQGKACAVTRTISHLRRARGHLLRPPGSGWGDGAHGGPFTEHRLRDAGGEDGVPCRFGPGMEVTHSKPSLPHSLFLSLARSFFFFFNPAWLRNVTAQKKKKKKALEESKKKKKEGGGFGSKGPFRSLYLCKGNHLHVCGDARVCLQLGRRGRAREECGESGRAAGGRAPAEPPSCCCINLLKEPLLCGGSTHRVLVWWRRPDLCPGYTTNWSGK